MRDCTDPDIGKDVLGYDSASETERAQLEGHMRECGWCRAELEDYKIASSALRQEAGDHPSAQDLFTYGSRDADAQPGPEVRREIESHLLICRDCREHVERLRAAEASEDEKGTVFERAPALDDARARRFAKKLALKLRAEASGAHTHAPQTPPARELHPHIAARQAHGARAKRAVKRSRRQGFPAKAAVIVVPVILAVVAAAVLFSWKQDVREPAAFRASDSVNLITPDDGARVNVYQEFRWQVIGANATYAFGVRDTVTRETVIQKEVGETSYFLIEKDARALVGGREYTWSVVGRLGSDEWRSPERRFIFAGRKTAQASFTDFDADARAAFEKQFREAAPEDLPKLQQKLEGYLKTHQGAETPDAGWVHHMLGSIFYRRDDRIRARDNYAAALQLWERLGIPDEVLYARTLGNYGLINQDAGNFERALTLYMKSLAVYGDSDDEVRLRRRGDSHLNIGTLYRELGLPEQALQHYKAALEIDRRQSNKGAMAEDLNNIGNLYVDEMDNPTQGVEFIREALALHREVAQSGPPRDTMADTFDSLGVAYTRLGDVAAAEQHFLEAIRLDTARGNDTGLLQTKNNLAELYKDYETVLGHYKDALVIAGRSEDADPDEVWKVYDGLGRAHLMGGNFGEAETHLRKAIEMLEQLRDTLIEKNHKRTFRLDRQSPYHNLGTLRLRQSDFTGLFDAVESSRASTLRELRATREGGGAAVAPATLDQLKQALAEDDVALEYFFASRKAPVLLLAVTREQVFGYELSTREEFDKLVKPLVSDIVNGADAASTRERFSELSRRLFPDQLLEQMRQNGARRVLISPDGVLHQLPFELLPVTGPGGDTGYLLEWLEVSVTPSLRWWYEARAEAAKLNGKSRDMLVVADPVTNSSECQVESPIFRDVLSSKISFAPLGHSRREAEIVAGYGARAPEMLLGDKATSQRLLGTRPTDFKVIHFATHAVSGGTLLTSALVFGCRNTLDILAGDRLKDLPMDGQLVVLSACDTDVGRPISGEGADSLTYGFLMTGAGSVIASRKLVKDDAPIPLMKDFYERLSEGATVDESLREAKLRSLRAGSDLATWSSFTAVGYGDMKVALNPATSVRVRRALSRYWGAVIIIVVVACAMAILVRRRRKARATRHEVAP